MPSIWMQKSSNFGIKPATMRGIFMRIFPGFKVRSVCENGIYPPVTAIHRKVGEFIQTKLGIHEPTQQFFEKLNHKFGTMFCTKSANFTGHQFLRPTQNVSPLASKLHTRETINQNNHLISCHISDSSRFKPKPCHCHLRVPSYPNIRALTWIPSLQILEIRRKLGT